MNLHLRQSLQIRIKTSERKKNKKKNGQSIDRILLYVSPLCFFIFYSNEYNVHVYIRIVILISFSKFFFFLFEIGHQRKLFYRQSWSISNKYDETRVTSIEFQYSLEKKKIV